MRTKPSSAACRVPSNSHQRPSSLKHSVKIRRREAPCVTCHKARRYSESAAECDAEVCEIPADASALDEGFGRRRLGVAAASPILDVLIDPAADHADAKVALGKPEK